jgi:hypothetical protein
MEQPYMDRSGVVHFPGGEHDSPRMGDSLVRGCDSSDLEQEQERDLREIDDVDIALALVDDLIATIERRGICQYAIARMIDRLEELRNLGRTA